MEQQAKKRRPLSKILRAVITLIACPIILLWGLMLLLYIPPIQKFAIKEICHIASEKSDYDISIGAFHLKFPLRISIDDFRVTQADSMLLDGSHAEIDLRIATLLKGEIEVNYISVDNTEINTLQLIGGIGIEGEIGHLRITARNIAPSDETAMIRELLLTDTHTKITLGDIPQKDEDSISKPINWIIGLHRCNISNLKVALNMPNDTTTLTTAIDYLALRNAEANLSNGKFSINKFMLEKSMFSYDHGTKSDSIAPLEHLHFNDINIEASNMSYAAPVISAEVETVTLKQKDGIEINRGRISLVADSTNIKIKELAINTKNGSRIKSKSTIPWEMLQKKNGGNMQSYVDIHINKRDLRKLITHDTYNKLHTLPDSLANIYIKAHGNLHKLTTDTLYAKIPNIAHIGSKGTVQNITNTDKIDGNIEFEGYVTDINRLLNIEKNKDSTAHHTQRLKGYASITHKQCSVAVRAKNGEGNIAIRASYNIADNSYTARARVKRLNISNIFPKTPLHELTMLLNVDGIGFNLLDTATQYRCNIHVDTLRYDSIFINSTTLTAIQQRGKSNISVSSSAPNLQLELSAYTHLDSFAISNNTHLSVAHADLYKMGLSKVPLTAKLSIDMNAFTNMKEIHKISLTGDNLSLITEKKKFAPSRLNFDLSTSPDTSYIKVNTGDLNINGTLDTGYNTVIAYVEHLQELYKKEYTNGMFVLHTDDYKKELPTLSLDIDCGKENILANYLRFNNIEFEKFNMQLKLDSIKGINGNCGIYNIKREEMQLDTIRALLQQKDEQIRYFIGVRTRSLNQEQKKLKFYSALFGALHNDSVTTNFVFRDNNDNVGARIKLNTLFKADEFELHFTPEATLFNRPFRFNKENYITLKKNLAIRADVELKDSLDTGMRIYSSNDTTQLRDISLELFNIDLKSATDMFPFAPNIAGMLNMNMHYREEKEYMMASGDIYGSDIIYEGTPMGDGTIELVYLPKSKDVHYVDVTMQHNDKQIFNLQGDYHNDSIKPGIDGKAEITRLPLQLANAFIKDTDIRLTGYINGKLAISGTPGNIESNGNIHFDSVYAYAPTLGTRLHLKDDNVDIINNKLTFRNFDIYAHGNTPFQVNGTIDIKHLTNPEFNLRMRANNYEIVNAKRDKNSMLYGRMFIDFNSMIRGTLNALSMNGSASLLGKSDITYVMQETPLATENKLDGLVQFVNFSDTTQMKKADDNEINFGNLTMNITLNIEEAARINADFDAERNSYIELQGGGTLNLTYSSESGLNLAGRYTLNDGQLKYALPIIPLKTFNISEGSYVNWTGDIMNPTLNIKALERTTSSVTMNDGNSQAVAFDVGVILTNTLDNMGLSFTLSAPENAAVQNELNSLDQETLNKYAVTMLITGAYLGSNGGITVSNALSSFLDATINDIAGNAMKSVDINLGITDVENNETGGTYKNYSFSFAKRFWNDRLTVIIGGEVNSGDTPNRNESFINNVSLEWKISESGNRYIRLFYDKNYESILEGEIIETGLGYVYKRKLNNLKELFIFKKRDDSEEVIIQPHRNSSNSKQTEK